MARRPSSSAAERERIRAAAQRSIDAIAAHAGCSLAALAKRAGLHPSTLIPYRRARYIPPPPIIARLGAAAGMTAEAWAAAFDRALGFPPPREGPRQRFLREQAALAVAEGLDPERLAEPVGA